MLQNPSILMLNCLGSYFYCMIENLNAKEKRHSLIYYLASGVPAYQKLSLDAIKQKYEDSSWGYQPVVLKKSNGENLSIDGEFFQYLSETHDMKVSSIELGKSIDVIYEIAQHTSEKTFCICNVDEFYIPTSTKSYQKKHNKHFLLIRSVDLLKSEFEIIDSERNNIILLPFQILEQAVYESKYQRNLLYRIDGSSYCNHVNPRKHLQSVVDNFRTCNYGNELLDDLQDKLKKENCLYFYQGYYYTILSKILPYSNMLYHLFQDNQMDVSIQVMKLVEKWRMLCNLMQLNMRKEKLSYEILERKIDEIIIIEEKIKICL